MKQQLQSLSDTHTTLVAQQHACATGDSATHDSELARLRTEVAEVKAEACMNADKLAATLETCRCLVLVVLLIIFAVFAVLLLHMPGAQKLLQWATETCCDQEHVQ